MRVSYGKKSAGESRMSVDVEDHYLAGKADGERMAEQDLIDGSVFAVADELRDEACRVLRYTTNRKYAAYHLGVARGYRQVVAEEA